MIRRFSALLTLAAVATVMYVNLSFDHKYAATSVVASPHFVVIDLIGPPQDPAVTAVLASAPAGKLDYVAALGTSQTSLARHNTEIAGALHAAGLAIHSQPRAQTKV